MFFFVYKYNRPTTCTTGTEFRQAQFKSSLGHQNADEQTSFALKSIITETYDSSVTEL